MTASSAPGDPSAADGPLVRVTLPDGQSLYAVASACRQEHDGSWGYDLQVHLLAQADVRGRLVAEPSPVTFRASATACTPVDGQDYAAVPTWRAAVYRPGGSSSASNCPARTGPF